MGPVWHMWMSSDIDNAVFITEFVSLLGPLLQSETSLYGTKSNGRYWAAPVSVKIWPPPQASTGFPRVFGCDV